jgi:hypothetical protein
MEANVAAESIDEEQLMSQGSKRLLQVLRKPEGFSGEPYYTHLNSGSDATYAALAVPQQVRTAYSMPTTLNTDVNANGFYTSMYQLQYITIIIQCASKHMVLYVDVYSMSHACIESYITVELNMHVLQKY